MCKHFLSPTCVLDPKTLLLHFITLMFDVHIKKLLMHFLPFPFTSRSSMSRHSLQYFILKHFHYVFYC